jgi:DNA-binding protein YbaB
MDFSKMLKQAQEMQQKMMEAKDGLKNVIAEGVAGGGSVKVQMNGHFELVKS